MPLHGQHLSALRVLEPEKEGEQLTSQSPDHAKEGFILVFVGADSASFTALFTTLRLATLPLTVASAAATDGDHLNATAT